MRSSRGSARHVPSPTPCARVCIEGIALSASSTCLTMHRFTSRARRLRSAALFGLFTVPALAAAQGGTRMLRTPSVSATHIAFAYANDVWIVERSGGVARRLTSGGGEANPKLSPDGRWVAFSGDYGGNTDVYVVSADGGEPKRLTWHPGADLVQGWTPDGQQIVFASPRATAAPTAAPRFWTVPAAGGIEQPMPMPRAYQGKIAPDGKRIAYRMNSSWDDERRNYRGGQNRPIWIMDLASHDVTSPPWTDSKDVDPAWVGDVVYFISDRDGVANVWSYDTRSKALTQRTRFTDFDVKTLDATANAVVFEQAGYIHEMDPETGRERVVTITAAGDFPWMMPQWKDSRAAHAGPVADRPPGRRRGARRDLHRSPPRRATRET